MIARLQRVTGAESFSSSGVDDKEAQLSNRSSRSSEVDDEEAQLSNRSSRSSVKENETSSSSGENESIQSDSVPPQLDIHANEMINSLDSSSESKTSQSNDGPPSLIKIALPQLDIRAKDIETINSIIGNINDPGIRHALNRIMNSTGDAEQYSTYFNQPNPSHHEWTAIDILYDGLLYVGFDTDWLQKNNIRRKTDWFKAFYGVEQTTVAPYLIDLREEYPDIDYRDCFMTLNWMCLYETYPVLSARWKRSEEYIGGKIIECSMKMAVLARKKISFKLTHDIELGRTVDCATFMIHEMRLDPNSKWFDWKTHSAGLVRLVILTLILFLPLY